MNHYPDVLSENRPQEESIDIKRQIIRFLQLWPWFVASLVTSMTFAYVFNKFATPAYRASATILIKEDQGYRRTNNLVSSLDLFSTQNNLQNEIGILNSYTLNYETVEDLGLYITYNKHGKYRQRDVYKSCPFVIFPDTSRFQATNVEIDIVPLSKTHVRISCKFNESVSAIKYSTGETMTLAPDESCNKSYEIKFGELFETSFFSFRVLPVTEINQTHINGEYYIVFHSLTAMASSYRSRLAIEPINKESSIVRIALVDPIPARAIDYVNRLATNYINTGLGEKNLIASRTIDFIDEQLTGITDSLSAIERNLESFRTQNKIVDLSAQGQAIYQKMQNLDYEKSMEQMKVGYYNYLLNYVQSDTLGKDIIAPSAIGVNDPLLTQLISELSQLYSLREQYRATSSGKNPYLSEINIKIETLRRSIVENVTNILANAQFVLTEKQKELNKVQAELQLLPQTERQLISIERLFTVNDQIYTYLLEKRAEAAISKASSVPDHKIIDTARVDSRIRPKSSQNYLTAFVLGLLIPAILIFIIDLARNTIRDISDVEALTKIPILGNVLHHSEGEVNITNISPSVAESFRIIRTNLDFFVTEKTKKIIAVSSMTPHEGKSFSSFHLAYVFSLTGKKTLLIGADIRKPDLGKIFNIKTEVGLSSFLSNRNTWDEIVNTSQFENFFFIPGGLVPPNPAELLSAENIDRIFNQLDPYDVVIFDTSPVGIIADAAYIIRKSDIILFVTRYNVSRKPNVKIINQVVTKLNVANPAIICNDFKRRSRRYYYYYYYSKMKVRDDAYYYYDGKKK